MDEEGDIPETMSSYQYVFEFREKMEESLRLAMEGLGKSQARYKRYCDKKTKERRFTVGDTILLLLPKDINKLLMHRRIPFEIERVVEINDYMR